MNTDFETRSMPSCPESEIAVINGVLFEGFATDLCPEDFNETKYKVIYQAFTEFKEENPINIKDPRLTLFQSFLNSHSYKDGLTYSNKLKDLEISIPVMIADYSEIPSQLFQRCCDEIKECSKRRKTIIEGRRAIENAYNKNLPIDNTITATARQFTSLNSDRKLPFKFYNVGKEIIRIDEQFTRNHDSKPYSTGFRNLDNCLGGGFHAGELIELGGMTGMNKTTICLQLTSNLIEQGHDVLYVSLEMTGEEIVAKLDCLYMHKITDERDYYADRNLRDYTAPYKAIQFGNVIGKDKTDRLGEATTELNKHINHLYVAEGVASIKVDDIIDLVKEHYLKTKKPPIVIVDYIQLLAPHNERGTDKVNADYNVLRLKQLATGNALADALGLDTFELKTVVLCVVANNRSSNGQTATESSGRDSSTLEYTADVLLSIEPSKLKELDGDKKKGQELLEEIKSKATRDLDIKIVKCRSTKIPPKDDMPSFTVYNGSYFKEKVSRYRNEY